MRDSPDHNNDKKWIKMVDIHREYKFLERVGKGTFGTVSKIKNIKDGKYYAFKKLENTDVKLET